MVLFLGAIRNPILAHLQTPWSHPLGIPSLQDPVCQVGIHVPEQPEPLVPAAAAGTLGRRICPGHLGASLSRLARLQHRPGGWRGWLAWPSGVRRRHILPFTLPFLLFALLSRNRPELFFKLLPLSICQGRGLLLPKLVLGLKVLFVGPEVPDPFFAAILVVELAPEALLTRVLVCHDLRIDVARQVLARSPFPAFLALLSLLPLEVPLRMLQLSLQQFFLEASSPETEVASSKSFSSCRSFSTSASLGSSIRRLRRAESLVGLRTSTTSGRLRSRRSSRSGMGEKGLFLLAMPASLSTNDQLGGEGDLDQHGGERDLHRKVFFFWGGVVGLRPGLGT